MAGLTKFKDNFERMEKEYMQFKNDYEIAKRSQETLQEELKKTKERNIAMDNTIKQKERTLRDMADKAKDMELKVDLKETKIQDLEAAVTSYKESSEESANFGMDPIGEESHEAQSRVARADSALRDEQFEAMIQQMNSLNDTLESQKASHTDQIKKLTDRIEELRKESSAIKRENDSLRVRLSQAPDSPAKKESPVAHKDESSILNEILQKSLELENSVRRYKLKSEELSQQLLKDREHFNSTLGILYSVASDRYLK